MDNLWDIMENQKDNQKTALIYKNKTLPYRELYQLARKNAICLSQINTGNNIGIYLPNSIDYVLAYFSIAYMKKTIVPFNVQAQQNELLRIMIYSGVSLIITNSDNFITLQKKTFQLEPRVPVYLIDTMEITAIGGKEALPMPINQADDNDFALLLHTSGSVSQHKCVMLTAQNLLSCARSIILSLELTENDTTLIALPLYLASANTSQLVTHLLLGATIIISDTLFTANNFYKTIQKYSITNLHSTYGIGFPTEPIWALKSFASKWEMRVEASVCPYM